MSKYLIISRLQRDNGPSSLQFGRLWSNRFGENRLTDACRAVFSKQAAPKSHAFLFCHEPLSPGTRCGELRGGLSSREPGAESLKHRKRPRRSRPAGSIGLCGGSYCRRSSSAAAGSGQRIANMAQLSNCSLGRSVRFVEIFDYKSFTKRQWSLVLAIWSTLEQ